MIFLSAPNQDLILSNMIASEVCLDAPNGEKSVLKNEVSPSPA